MKVYKYRGGNTKRDLESLVNNYFWAPTADQLNDPTEAYVNESDVRNFLQIIRAVEVEATFDSVMKMRHTLGIYSLSRTPFDELMWAYYAASHSGFCIEYDLKRLTLEARTAWDIVEVTYQQAPQIINPSDMLHDKQNSLLKKIIGTKSLRWAHEEEIRIITNTPGKNYYASSAITGIYFGSRCLDEDIDYIRRQLCNSEISYHRIETSSHSYSINARPIEYDPKIDGLAKKYLSPIDEGAVPDIKELQDKYKRFYNYLIEAVQIVRCDPSCIRVLQVDFSLNKIQNNEPIIFVAYETNVPTPFYNRLNRNFSIEELRLSTRKAK